MVLCVWSNPVLDILTSNPVTRWSYVLRRIQLDAQCVWSNPVLDILTSNPVTRWSNELGVIQLGAPLEIALPKPYNYLRSLLLSLLLTIMLITYYYKD